MSRHEKACNFADIKEKCPIYDEESEAECTRKLIYAKLCLISTQSYTDKLKIKFRPFENSTQKKRR
jgi:hypothetical protein